MIIPTWVERGQRTKAEKKRARLKFLINSLAARFTTGGSIRQFGTFVGLDHSTISGYIQKGEFSESAATTIVAKVNDPMITVAMLRDPMQMQVEIG